MKKAEPHTHPHNRSGRTWQSSTNLGTSSNLISAGTDTLSAGGPGTSTSVPLAQVPDLRVSAERIRYFADLDLGELVDLPGKREDLVALSIRMDAAFSSLLGAILESIHEEYAEISRKALEEAICREIVLDFIERYGAVAFFSSDVVRVLKLAERLDSPKGRGFLRQLKFLKQVGQRLAVFVACQKRLSPQRKIGIAFKLSKPQFLAELEQLSRQLDASSSNDSKADQLLGLVRTGKYEMLRQNLQWLEEFLRCDAVNPYLRAKNEVAADRLAQYGSRTLTSEREQSITPDWFFYTWVAWVTNKSPKTVRRLIQTAESSLRGRIASYEKSHKQ